MVYVTVRLNEDARIESVEVDASTQTEEVGGACSQAPFTDQFVGKSIPVALGSDVDAVSGATLTSAAAVEAVNSARAFVARRRGQNHQFYGRRHSGHRRRRRKLCLPLP